MIEVDEVIKTFLECIDIDTSQMSGADKEKISKIMDRTMVDMCYTMVPEVDQLVSDHGIYKPASPEHGAVMKAFLSTQRKVLFAMVKGIVVLKTRLEKLESERVGSLASIEDKLEKMESRINGVTRLKNTSLVSTQHTPATLVTSKPNPTRMAKKL